MTPAEYAKTVVASVKVPEGAEWELYSSMPGSKAAAKSLTAAMKKALADLAKALPNTPPTRSAAAKAIGAVYKKHLSARMSKYRNLGAEDTEPYYHSVQPLIAATKKYYGWNEYMEELADYCR